MAISKIVRTLFFLCLGLGVVTVVSVYFMSRNIGEQSVVQQKNFELLLLSQDIERASALLTREAISYTLTGEQDHLDAYTKGLATSRSREPAIGRMVQLGASAAGLDLLRSMKTEADAIVLWEQALMASVSGASSVAAAQSFFQGDHALSKASVADLSAEFRLLLAERGAAGLSPNALIAGSVSLVLFFVLFAVAALFFCWKKMIPLPLKDAVQTLVSLASGNVVEGIAHVDDKSEIGDIARASVVFRESLQSNTKLSADLERFDESLELRVEKRTKDLSAANDELEEFAYRTSHDLRSPINSSSRLLQMVQKSLEGGNSDQALVGLNHAQTSLNKLETLISDMLVLAEAKGKGEDSEVVDFETLTKAALEKMMHMEFYDRLDVQTDFAFTGDLFSKQSRINMVLENLISNAIKYQDPDKDRPYIKISTKLVDGWVYMEVEDNGLGVPKEQQKKLFSMFQRFHPKVSFGSGLGLYLLKKCADVVGGEIGYLDNPASGGGSIFRLTIPMDLAEAA